MENDIPTRVAKGVALLDEQKPGWVDQIDLDTLRLTDADSCVLGQPADVLEKAADLYESETIDWCQGEMYKRGSVVSACAQGALQLAAGFRVLRNGYVALLPVPGTSHEWNVWNRYLRAREALEDHLSNGIVVTSSWNDRPGRTKQEVIQAMKECAKDLRNIEGES